eukprot:m.134393 g.134393  ORF g.134393 m.134393 type:complete len:131 (+) comp9586_c0_seq1:492-884(+)
MKEKEEEEEEKKKSMSFNDYDSSFDQFSNDFVQFSGIDQLNAGALETVHIGKQDRNGRKCVTTVVGIHPDYDLKKMLKVLRKELGCNGNIDKIKGDGRQVLLLQGDKREDVKDFLKLTGIVGEEQIKIHG